jgi:sodium-dependent dicarboxylate transporter 2/3/5
MGIMTGVAGEPWAIGLAVALASSYAHFLIVGSPTNALTFALGVYPDSNKRVLEAIDFVKYGFGIYVLSMLLLWLIGFLVVYPVVGFPDEILKQATEVLQSTAVN